MANRAASNLRVITAIVDLSHPCGEKYMDRFEDFSQKNGDDLIMIEVNEGVPIQEQLDPFLTLGLVTSAILNFVMFLTIYRYVL